MPAFRTLLIINPSWLPKFILTWFDLICLDLSIRGGYCAITFYQLMFCLKVYNHILGFPLKSSAIIIMIVLSILRPPSIKADVLLQNILCFSPSFAINCWSLIAAIRGWSWGCMLGQFVYSLWGRGGVMQTLQGRPGISYTSYTTPNSLPC